MAGYKGKRKPAFFKKDKGSVQDDARISNFKISFQYFDTTQKYGSSFRDWQKAGLLSRALETLYGYCRSTLMEQVDGDKFTIYGSFPPKNKTMFEYPQHVPEDANWARIHVNGPAVIIGHIVRDTFYVVFLDKTHKFWLTKRDRQVNVEKNSEKTTTLKAEIITGNQILYTLQKKICSK